MLTLKVIDKRSGNPMVRARVVVFYGAFNLNTKEETTDSQGEAHFNIGAGDYRITVNGSHYSGDHKLRVGRNVVYV